MSGKKNDKDGKSGKPEMRFRGIRQRTKGRMTGPNTGVDEKKLEEVSQKLDALHEKHEEATKKPPLWLRFITSIVKKPFQTIMILVGGASGWLMGTLAQEGDADALLFNRFSIEHSQGPCIHGGRSSTAYTEIGNKLAQGLSDNGYVRHGFCDPSPGSEANLKRLSPDLDMVIPSNEKGFAIAQKDVLLKMHEQGQAAYTFQLLDLKEAAECAFMPANDSFSNFSALAEESFKRDAQNPLKIGLVKQGSGSYITGQNILSAAFNDTGVEVKIFHDPQSIVQAVNEGKIDAGMFVEYPGRVQGKFQSGLASAFKEQVNLLPMSEQSYEATFASSPYQYNLLEPTIHKEFSWNPYTYMEYFGEGDRTLPSMLCTNAVIAARSAESVENDALKDQYLSHLYDVVKTKIGPDDLKISEKTVLKTIAESKPLQAMP